MGYSCKILCDSVSPDGVRLTTIEIILPRLVIAELNTHRQFSRNSASSRAIPIKKMLERVINDPFTPVYYGKNQQGMQASEELSPEAKAMALELWLNARDNAVTTVKRLQMPDIDLHKQIANRLLEPFLWHTVLITATEWRNFFALRCNKDAQPEIRMAAEMMRDAYNASTPEKLDYGQWHMPLLFDKVQLIDAGYDIDDMCKISVGRCARVSYMTHDGVRAPEADIQLCERLQKSGHLSPMEHVARPMHNEDFDNDWLQSNFRGWVQFRKTIPNEHDFSLTNLEHKV